MPARTHLLTASLSLLVAAIVPALAQINDGTWKGQISCAKLSFTKGAQKVAMTMTVAGEKASYERQVYNPNNTQVVGTESGNGTIDASGAIKLSATWKGVKDSPRWTYTASYSGTIKGKSANLSGTQLWKSIDGKSEDRKCSIALKH